ncbi:hypothetical protein N9Q78_01875 [Polaribacter sp.]|nr:hypothetical protein [Polaribacter sp.]
MGHSSINVSLTYLRGLEIAELKEEEYKDGGDLVDVLHDENKK